VSAVSGGIWAELTNILDNPEAIIDLLANSLPAQSSYFMQIILAKTFLMQSLEMLRVYPLSLSLIRNFIGPNLTKKERSRSYGPIRSLEDPPDFWHAETFAQIILYFMVYFVYAAIAPVRMLMRIKFSCNCNVLTAFCCCRYLSGRMFFLVCLFHYT
jgi:hypothetical protein